VPDFATAVAARKFYEAFSTFEADWLMSQVFERLEITPWSTTEIQNPIGCCAFYVFQKRVTILADVMILRAFPETIRAFVVMAEGDERSLRKLFSGEPRSVGFSHAMNEDSCLT
jgi:hypothetical protein